MPEYFCEEANVRRAMQKSSTDFGSGALDSNMVLAAIERVSGWFRRQTNGHWFDGSGSGTLVGSSAATASDVVCDVPSSPHSQPRRLISDHPNARYPVQRAGPYARITLPHLYVTAIDKLEVRDVDGGVTDWVADSSFTSGRGNDYYLQSRGQNSYGRTYLYISGREIGARFSFDELLTLGYTYGLDSQTEDWQDVRRGVANLAAADLVTDDDVLAQLPDSGQLINVDTEHQQFVDRADAMLTPYMSAMGDNR